MKKLLILALSLLSGVAQCQINSEDNSVQIIAFFDKGEKQTYDFLYEKAKVKGTDTTTTVKVKYKVDITVVDSTATSYTIEWKYRDYHIDNADLMTKKLLAMYEGLVIRFTTDELGSVTAFENWEEIRDHNKKMMDIVLGDLKNDKTIRAIMEKFMTREVIESSMTKDIAMFHSFHGIGLSMDEVIEEEIEEESPLGGKPIKSAITLELEQIDVENSDFIVKFYQSFDSSAIGDIMTSVVGEFIDTIPADVTEKMNEASLEDYLGAQIHESGWLITAYYERVITIDDMTGIEMRTLTIE